MANLIDRILAEVCLDDRIPDGVFDMSNNSHMDALRECMENSFNMSLNDCRDIHNKMLEGKYPERQAYNKDGLLVTFPTPQHKAKAIQRGTHFEQDPTKGASNVFAGGQGQEKPAPNVFAGNQQPPAQGAPKSEPAPAQGAAPAPQGQEKPAQPAGQSEPSKLPASETPPPAPSAPSAPSGGGGASSLPASGTPPPAAPGQPPLEVEPANAPAPGKPGAPVPPPNFDTPKSPEVRAAEADTVKQIMAGDENNPSLNPEVPQPPSPTMPVNVSELLTIAEKIGFEAALKVISEAMNKK